MFSNKTRRIISAIENGASTIVADEQISAFKPYAAYPSFQVKELFYTEDAEQTLQIRHLPKKFERNINTYNFLLYNNNYE